MAALESARVSLAGRTKSVVTKTIAAEAFERPELAAIRLIFIPAGRAARYALLKAADGPVRVREDLERELASPTDAMRTWRRFLNACSLHGTMLALSQQDGIAGGRTLPLLVSDRDWDRLGQLVNQLEDQDLAQLLLALHGVRSAEIARSRNQEARNLAAHLLTAIARHWNERHRPLPVSLIENWYALRESAPGAIHPPQLGPAWAELYPGSPPAGRLERSELARADEWLALAQTLLRYDPDTLKALGFFKRDQELIGHLAETLERTTDADTRPIAESILTRIEELAPGRAYQAANHTLMTIQHDTVGERRRWVPEDIPTPPSTDPVPTAPVEFTREDVDRVLSDL